MKKARWLLYVGLLLIGFGIYWYDKNSKWVETAIKVEGQVIEIVTVRGSDSTTYKPRIKYKDPRGSFREYLHPISQSPTPFEVGEMLPVFLDPVTHEPSLGTFFSLYFVSVLTIFLGTMMLGIYWLINKVGSSHETKLKELKASGLSVSARVTNIRKESFKVNDKSPWVIEAQSQCPVTFQHRTFESRYLWEKPSVEIGGDVRVYISRAKPKKYVMDV